MLYCPALERGEAVYDSAYAGVVMVKTANSAMANPPITSEGMMLEAGCMRTGVFIAENYKANSDATCKKVDDSEWEPDGGKAFDNNPRSVERVGKAGGLFGDLPR